MSNEMKVIMERWDRFVIQEKANPDWVTWRVLAGLIKLAQETKKGMDTSERKKKLLKIGGRQALKLGLSLLGPLGAVIDSSVDATEVIVDMVKVYVQADDSKTKNNPFLDAFNLDDGFEDLIDDKIEDQFIEKMIKELPGHIQNNPDQKIPDFDNVIKAWLPTLNLSGTTNNNVTKTGV